MAQTIRLSRQALGQSSPNPAVGAVVVKNGQVVGQGVHVRAGAPHAEVLALHEAGEMAQGATIYVNLEPCNHHGRTPPCTHAILEAGIKRVVYGIDDPSLKAQGGARYLGERGIELKGQVLAQECAYVHRFFLTHQRLHRPYIIMKSAVSLDGRIATFSGQSQWITGEKARRYSHKLRGQVDAIMVGLGTVLADNPRLSNRVQKERNPLRLVVDSHLKTPAHAAMLKEPGATIIAASAQAAPDNERALQDAGAQIWRLPADSTGRVSLPALLGRLGENNITSLMVEGGATLAFSLAELTLIDELWLFMAPMIIGGDHAPSFMGGRGFASLTEALKFHPLAIRRLGDDILLTARRKEN